MNERIQFLFSLYLIGRKVRGHYKKRNEDGMLSATILNLLYGKGETITHLANQLSTKVSAVSEKVIAMEKEKLIKKVKVADGRETYVELTAKGRDKMEKLTSVMEKHCALITSGLTDNEVGVMLPLLRKLAG